MDSVHSHSFPGFSQPDNQFDQLYQSHPHLQLDETSDFPLPTSSSVSLSSSMFPLPGDYQFSPPPSLSLSRRGSDCSLLSGTSSEGDGVMMVVEPRGRLTREHICLLERQFFETPKPNAKIRRSLAEATGLSVQRISNWFQHRRAKAKQQKRQEEIHTRQILAQAGRRRVTEPSSPALSGPSISSGSYPVDSIMSPIEPRRAKSVSEIPRTSVPVGESGADISPYSSPSEASYASLARSIAVAAAAAARAEAVGGFQENPQEIHHMQDRGPFSSMPLPGTESPWLMSHFSDYGSSTASSVIYTPTPAGQLEDPFEYDQVSPEPGRSEQTQSNSNVGYFDYRYTVEDISGFVAALDTTTDRTFVLPAVLPTRFLRTAPSNSGPFNGEQQQMRQRFAQHDSCPNEFVATFGSVGLEHHQPSQLSQETTEPEPQLSLAMRRRAPGLPPLGVASVRNSLTGGLPRSARKPQTAFLSLPCTPMRRVKSTGATGFENMELWGYQGSSPPSSPVSPLGSSRLSDRMFPDEDDAMAGETIRPRTTGSLPIAPSAPLSQLFSQHGAPPTPVSPANPVESGTTEKEVVPTLPNTPDECPSLHEDCNDDAATHTQHTQVAAKLTNKSRISPPQTPHSPTDDSCSPRKSAVTTPTNYHFSTSRSLSPKVQIAQHDEDSVPRDFYSSGAMRELFEYTLPEGEVSSDGSKEEEVAFPFENLLAAAAANGGGGGAC